ncbi:helix-turn-helix domain-containing protein [Streptomyces syringium]|uniref:helix-turn-helix domain-containing protein n=1 Tax=Streptomyces syringium TaxID=76729 RepID=UPI0033F15B95
MARPPAMPADKKVEIILAVLSGDTSAAQAARDAGVSDQAIGNWKRRFIAAGREGLQAGQDQSTRREQQLLEEIIQLKSALGDSYLQLQNLRAHLRSPAPIRSPHLAPRRQ